MRSNSNEAFQHFRGIRVVLVFFVCYGIVRISRRVLDVVDLVPQSLEPYDVVNVLPHDARNRAAALKSHYDNTLSLHGRIESENPCPDATYFFAKSPLPKKSHEWKNTVRLGEMPLG